MFNSTNLQALGIFFESLFAARKMSHEYTALTVELSKLDLGSPAYTQKLSQLESLLETMELNPDELERLEEIFESNLNTLVQNQSPVIIGNGDVRNHTEARERVEQTGVDGVMIGRGIFSNPFAFNPNIVEDKQGNLINIATGQAIGKTEKLSLLAYHLQLWEQTWQGQKNYAAVKKYYKIYASGFEGASDLRVKLMDTNNVQQAISLIETYLQSTDRM